jgi:peptide/nickel transport system permease protein
VWPEGQTLEKPFHTVLAFTIRRLGQSAFVLVVMAFIVFVGVYAIGDPIELLVNPQADTAERVRATAALGLDKPFAEQFISFLGGAVRGDLGRSFVFNVPAIQLIFDRLPATLELAGAAMVIAVALGIPLGLIAGLKPGIGARPRHHGRLDPRLQPADVLGRAGADHGVLGALRLAAAQRAAGETTLLFGVPVSFLTADGLAHLAMPRSTLRSSSSRSSSGSRARDTRGAAPGLREVRARQGAFRRAASSACTC